MNSSHRAVVGAPHMNSLIFGSESAGIFSSRLANLSLGSVMERRSKAAVILLIQISMFFGSKAGMVGFFICWTDVAEPEVAARTADSTRASVPSFAALMAAAIIVSTCCGHSHPSRVSVMAAGNSKALSVGGAFGEGDAGRETLYRRRSSAGDADLAADVR